MFTSTIDGSSIFSLITISLSSDAFTLSSDELLGVISLLLINTWLGLGVTLKPEIFFKYHYRNKKKWFLPGSLSNRSIIKLNLFTQRIFFINTITTSNPGGDQSRWRRPASSTNIFIIFIVIIHIKNFTIYDQRAFYNIFIINYSRTPFWRI